VVSSSLPATGIVAPIQQLVSSFIGFHLPHRLSTHGNFLASCYRDRHSYAESTKKALTAIPLYVGYYKAAIRIHHTASTVMFPDSERISKVQSRWTRRGARGLECYPSQSVPTQGPRQGKGKKNNHGPPAHEKKRVQAGVRTDNRS
jgi:hypothetical protein